MSRSIASVVNDELNMKRSQLAAKSSTSSSTEALLHVAKSNGLSVPSRINQLAIAESKLSRVILPKNDEVHAIATSSASVGTSKGHEAIHVVNENDYLDGLSAIIERDYFPELPKMRLQVKLLEAKSQKEKEYYAIELMKIKQIEAQNKERKEKKHISDVNKIVQKPTDGSYTSMETENLTVDQFLDKFRSEDNVSFAILVEKEQALRRKTKERYLYKKEEIDKLALELRNQEKLAIEYSKNVEHDLKRLRKNYDKKMIALMSEKQAKGILSTTQEQLASLVDKSIIGDMSSSDNPGGSNSKLGSITIQNVSAGSFGKFGVNALALEEMNTSRGILALTDNGGVVIGNDGHRLLQQDHGGDADKKLSDGFSESITSKQIAISKDQGGNPYCEITNPNLHDMHETIATFIKETREVERARSNNKSNHNTGIIDSNIIDSNGRENEEEGNGILNGILNPRAHSAMIAWNNKQNSTRGQDYGGIVSGSKMSAAALLGLTGLVASADRNNHTTFANPDSLGLQYNGLHEGRNQFIFNSASADEITQKMDQRIRTQKIQDNNDKYNDKFNALPASRLRKQYGETNSGETNRDATRFPITQWKDQAREAKKALQKRKIENLDKRLEANYEKMAKDGVFHNEEYDVNGFKISTEEKRNTIGTNKTGISKISADFLSTPMINPDELIKRLDSSTLDKLQSLGPSSLNKDELDKLNKLASDIAAGSSAAGTIIVAPTTTIDSSTKRKQSANGEEIDAGDSISVVGEAGNNDFGGITGASPLMTYGEILSTPLLVDMNSDTRLLDAIDAEKSGKKYNIPEMADHEKKLHDILNKKKKEKDVARVRHEDLLREMGMSIEGGRSSSSRSIPLQTLQAMSSSARSVVSSSGISSSVHHGGGSVKSGGASVHGKSVQTLMAGKSASGSAHHAGRSASSSAIKMSKLPAHLTPRHPSIFDRNKKRTSKNVASIIGTDSLRGGDSAAGRTSTHGGHSTRGHPSRGLSSSKARIAGKAQANELNRSLGKFATNLASNPTKNLGGSSSSCVRAGTMSNPNRGKSSDAGRTPGMTPGTSIMTPAGLVAVGGSANATPAAPSGDEEATGKNPDVAQAAPRKIVPPQGLMSVQLQHVDPSKKRPPDIPSMEGMVRKKRREGQ